ncbi:ABC transporter substrate-binding protein [Candidatus Peregrinibacteria bacterium]|nr:ABC transporter substrate-binding protein [Candidatus Peregrinibacteria bacterium]
MTSAHHSHRHVFLGWALVLAASALLLTLGFALWNRFKIPNVALPPRPPLRLSIDIWPGNFWVIVADKMGYFKEEGLPVELVDISADYLQSLDDLSLGNRVDAGLMTPFDLMHQNLKPEAHLIGVMVSDSSVSAEGIVAKPENHTLLDLVGKRVGVEHDSYLDFYLNVLLKSAGLSKEDITVVDIDTDTLVDSFGALNLDAAMAWEPILGQVRDRYAATTLFTADQIKGLSWSIWAMKRSFLDSRPEDVVRMLKAWNKATQLIKSHPAQAMALVASVTFKSDPGHTFTVPELIAMLKDDALLDLSNNIKSFSFLSGPESVYGSLHYISRYLTYEKKISGIPPPDDLLDPRYLRSVFYDFDAPVN